MGWVFLLFLVCFSFQQKVKKIKRDEISVQNCLLKKSTYCPALDAEFFSYNCFILSEKDDFLPCSLSIYGCLALYLKSVASSYFFSWFLSFSLIPRKKQQGMLLVSLCRFSSSQLKDTHRTKCTNQSPSANLVPRAPLFASAHPSLSLQVSGRRGPGNQVGH